MAPCSVQHGGQPRGNSAKHHYPVSVQSCTGARSSDGNTNKTVATGSTREMSDPRELLIGNRTWGELRGRGRGRRVNGVIQGIWAMHNGICCRKKKKTKVKTAYTATTGKQSRKLREVKRVLRAFFCSYPFTSCAFARVLRRNAFG